MLFELMAESNTSSRSAAKRRTIDRVSGGFVNAILGALILWVGQTTFRHAGELASVSERFDGVGHQFDAVDKRHESLRQRLEETLVQLNDRTRSRFTREDGDKIVFQIKEIDDQQTSFERQMLERLTGLQLKLIALETRGNSAQELASLRAEVGRLRAYYASQWRDSDAYAQPIPTTASAIPVHLPPTTLR